MFLGLNLMAWALIATWVAVVIVLGVWYYRSKIRVIFKVEFYQILGDSSFVYQDNTGVIYDQKAKAIVEHECSKDFKKKYQKNYPLEKVINPLLLIKDALKKCSWATPMQFVTSKEFKPNNPHVMYDGYDYVIDMSRPCVTDGRKTIYCFDINSKNQIWYGGKIDIPHSIRLFKLLNHLFGSLVLDKAFGKVSNKEQPLLFVLLLLVGVLVGMVVMFVFYPYLIPHVASAVNATAGGL